jgi:hypothetical protein
MTLKDISKLISKHCIEMRITYLEKSIKKVSDKYNNEYMYIMTSDGLKDNPFKILYKSKHLKKLNKLYDLEQKYYRLFNE